jgi:hypothetical protein
MEKKRILIIATLLVLALAAWALVRHLGSAKVDPVVVEQLQWKITDMTEAMATTTPQNEVALVVAGVAVPIGTYAGSCNLIDGDIAELLPGEVSGVICTKSGDGQEIGVFSEGGRLVLKQGVVHKDDSGVSRTSFVELKKI